MGACATHAPCHRNIPVSCVEESRIHQHRKKRKRPRRPDHELTHKLSSKKQSFFSNGGSCMQGVWHILTCGCYPVMSCTQSFNRLVSHSTRKRAFKEELGKLKLSRSSSLRSDKPVMELVASENLADGSDWLNALLQQWWPHLSEFLTCQLIDAFEPQLQASLPWPLNGIKFERNSCHLGKTPILIEQVYSAKLLQRTRKGDLENLLIQVDCDWEGDSSLYLKVGGAGLGVSHVMISGTISVELVGMLDDAPLFQGFCIFFQDPPEVTLSFQGVTMPLALVRSTVEHLFVKLITDLLVLPNRVGRVLADEFDVLLIKRPCSEGVLQISIRADDLPAMDLGVFGEGTSDPYVVVMCGALKCQTEVHHNTLSPKFKECFVLPISSVAHQRVFFELFDEDLGKKDDFIGQAQLSVASSLEVKMHEEVCLDLTDRTGNPQSGRLYVSVEWTPIILAERNTGRLLKSGLVYFGVYHASGVPCTPADCSYFVVARITQEHIEKTGPAEWETWRRTPADATASMVANDMKERQQLLQQYGVPIKDQAKILGMEESKLLLHLKEETCELTWEQGYEFYVRNAPKATLELTFMQESPHIGIQQVGKSTLRVNDVLKCEHLTQVSTVHIGSMVGIDIRTIVLKYRLQFRPFGLKPSWLAA